MINFKTQFATSVLIICTICGGVFSETQFSVNSLFDLHNTTRVSHNLKKLELDTHMCLKAEKLAKNFLNEKFIKTYVSPDNEKGMNMYCYLGPLYMLTSKKIFNYWLRYETYYNTKNQLIERPARILWRDTKKIGIGYATSGNRSVVIAFYDPYNIN